MVPFGGWDMPVEYIGIIAEHLAVRTQAGLFDVSHMGRVTVEDGAQSGSALALLQSITCNDVAKLQNGQAHYNALLNERAGIVDDMYSTSSFVDLVFHVLTKFGPPSGGASSLPLRSGMWHSAQCSR